MSKVLVRFAPSPTGWLHVGNVRTAMVNYLFAKSLGGQFMLRIDDTDIARSEAQYEAGIQEDLQWLGLQWDRIEKQSNYFPRYEELKQKLIADGRLYPCYETAEEIEVKRKMLISRGLPPIYDRAGLTETDEQRKKYEAEGRRPHWRFKLNHAPIVWDDLIRGRTEFDGSKLSDPVLFREDGVVLFTFATSVDDGDMGITHIIRGEDHVSNTAIQVQIMEAMGYTPPMFGHMALLKMKEGKISKRVGGGDIRSLRDMGIFPLVLASYLAKIGTSDAIELADSVEALIAAFDIKKLGRAMANYDAVELERMNQKYLHRMSFSEASQITDNVGLRSFPSDITEEFWNKIRSNLKDFSDIHAWAGILLKPLQYTVELNAVDKQFVKDAASYLPDGEWSEQSWDQFVENVKSKTGRSGKELFMPLRVALTNAPHGPDMKTVFALLGRTRAEKRLRGEIA